MGSCRVCGGSACPGQPGVLLGGMGGNGRGWKWFSGVAHSGRHGGCRHHHQCPWLAPLGHPSQCPSQSHCSFSSLSLVSLCAPSSSEGFGIAEKIVLLSFISAVILMAILGNLLVMVAVCRDRQLR